MTTTSSSITENTIVQGNHQIIAGQSIIVGGQSILMGGQTAYTVPLSNSRLINPVIYTTTGIQPTVMDYKRFNLTNSTNQTTNQTTNQRITADNFL